MITIDAKNGAQAVADATRALPPAASHVEAPTVAPEHTPSRGSSRWLVGLLVGIAASFAAVTAAPAAGDTRTLDLYYTHTKERLTITFKKNGKYVPSALKELNRFLRDWRRNEPTNMDPRLFDTVWEVYQRSGSRQPIHIVSAYRSLATNNMLRSRSKAVAKHSQHTLGKAMDFFLPDVKVSTLREIGMSLQRGGVGYYPNANSPFVHIDVGSVRAWPRMNRTQLARLFPDGKTVHLPADGKPLARYQEALAELKRNGSVARPLAIAEDEGSQKKGKVGLLAMLFGDEEDESEELGAASTVGQSVTASEPRSGKGPVMRSVPTIAAPEPAAPEPVPAEPAPVVVAAAPAPPAAPERPADPGVTSLADATLPQGAAPLPASPAPVEVAAAPPPPAPPRKPEVPIEVAAVEIDPDLLPKPRPNVGSMVEAPVEVASAAPVPLPAAAADQPKPGEPVDAQMALAEVAEGAGAGTAPISALGYASATEAPAFNRNAPLTMASLTRDPVGRGATGASDSLSPLPPPSAAFGMKADPLAVLTRQPTAALAVPVLSGADSTYRGAFALMVHPNQRSGELLFTTPTVVVQAAFDTRPYGAMSSRYFSGASLQRLPITVFASAQSFAAAR